MVNAATTTATGRCAGGQAQRQAPGREAGSGLRLAAIAVAVLAAPICLLGSCAGKRDSGSPAQPAEGAARPCSAQLKALADQLITAKRAVVIKPVADLMERPDPGSPLADQALLGDVVSVLSAPSDCRLPGGSLLPIQTATGYRGHIAILALMPWPQAAPPYRSGTLWRVVSRFANVYAQPDLTRSNPLLVLPLGVVVRHQRQHDQRWIELVLPDGRHGFAQRGDLRPEEPSLPLAPPSAAQCVVEQALAHEGSPYLWGGRSTYGIDCSGLVVNAYQACGMMLPRDASQQFRWDGLRPVGQPVIDGRGTKVCPVRTRARNARRGGGSASFAGGGGTGRCPLYDELAALLPGDLLFFAATDAVPAAGGQPDGRLRAKITHVGLYLGDGRFVHATTSDRPTVHQSQLRDPEWLRRWVGTRRHPQLSPKAQ